MPIITVTGATGQFGNLVIDHLLRRGVAAQDLRASVRDVAKAAHHQARGIEVRRGDFDDPEALRIAFDSTQNLLIISTDRVGSRLAQHQRAVEAAQAVGVQRIFYTSVVDMQAGEATSPIAIDHRATEALIRASGVPSTLLRNTFYAEYLLGSVVRSLDQAVFFSSVGDARLGAAARTDLAEAAAAALIEPGYGDQVYELTYPRAWDYHEAVEVVARVSGRPLVYRPLPESEMEPQLRQAGVPEGVIQMALGMERSLRRGDLSKTTPDLEQLLGHPVTTLEEIARRLLS